MLARRIFLPSSPIIFNTIYNSTEEILYISFNTYISLYSNINYFLFPNSRANLPARLGIRYAT